ncbi:baeRF11 domain-containing protein [Parafrigoribacterium humi]|uniref:baeRF11 domain-containing protein n=1 Tax=Parafrigoribacterium humi TaxID=3144664 RepID=UPI0032EBB8EA
MLYVDIPTSSDLVALSERRDAQCVSLYLPTSPIRGEAEASRIELKNLTREAITVLREQGGSAEQIEAIEEHLNALIDDGEFWRYQARSLAVFVTPDHIRHYRLASELDRQVHVSDRFQLAQLLRAVTFPNAGYVLLLTEGEARVVEVSADVPATTLTIPGLPESSEPFKTQPIADRLPRARAQGTLGDASAQRQFARRVNSLVRDHLRGSGLPLVVAASEPMLAIYRAMNTYPRLADAVISSSAAMSDSELAREARSVFDEVYARELAAWRDLFEDRDSAGRATTDIASAARAASFGAVHSIMIDITRTMPGTIADDGTVTLADSATAENYDALGEIAARVLKSDGEVLAVRSEDIPAARRWPRYYATPCNRTRLASLAAQRQSACSWVSCDR